MLTPTVSVGNAIPLYVSSFKSADEFLVYWLAGLALRDTTHCMVKLTGRRKKTARQQRTPARRLTVASSSPYAHCRTTHMLNILDVDGMVGKMGRRKGQNKKKRLY